MPWNDFEPVDIEHVNKMLSRCYVFREAVPNNLAC